MDCEVGERLMRLEKIMTVGGKIYTPVGLNNFLSMPLGVFGDKTGYDMILLDKHEVVVGALAADYEGIGF